MLPRMFVCCARIESSDADAHARAALCKPATLCTAAARKYVSTRVTSLGDVPSRVYWTVCFMRVVVPAGRCGCKQGLGEYSRGATASGRGRRLWLKQQTLHRRCCWRRPSSSTLSSSRSRQLSSSSSRPSSMAAAAAAGRPCAASTTVRP